MSRHLLRAVKVCPSVQHNPCAPSLMDRRKCEIAVLVISNSQEEDSAD